MCLYKAPFPLTYTYISIILVPSFPSPVVDPILHASSCFVSIVRQTDAPLWKGRSLSDVHCVTTESVIHLCSQPPLIRQWRSSDSSRISFTSACFLPKSEQNIVFKGQIVFLFIYRRSERVRVHFDM